MTLTIVVIIAKTINVFSNDIVVLRHGKSVTKSQNVVPEEYWGYCWRWAVIVQTWRAAVNHSKHELNHLQLGRPIQLRLTKFCSTLGATGSAPIENNEASTKFTTANGRTFTWTQVDSVANHVTARSISDWRALTWLATATGWTRRKRSAICSGKLIVSTWFDTTWIGGTASGLYMCKSVLGAYKIFGYFALKNGFYVAFRMSFWDTKPPEW